MLEVYVYDLFIRVDFECGAIYCTLEEVEKGRIELFTSRRR